MKCPNGHDVNSQVKFCPICGVDLRGIKYCTNCGNERNGDGEICPHCGKPFLIRNHSSDDIRTKSNNKLIIILSIICVCFIVYVLCLCGSKENHVVTNQSIPVSERINEIDEEVFEVIDSVPSGNEAISSEEIAPNRSSSDITSSSSYNVSESSSSNSSSEYYSEPTHKTFANAQYVTMYLANQIFTNYSGVDIRIDGSLRMYIDGDYAGVVSVLRYNATSAMLRFGGGSYGEGKIGVRIEGDRLQLNDPIDGTIWYQK